MVLYDLEAFEGGGGFQQNMPISTQGDDRLKPGKFLSIAYSDLSEIEQDSFKYYWFDIHGTLFFKY